MLLPLLLIMLMVCPAPGKRAAPANVEPVIHDGIRYLAPNDNGRRAYIEAWDVETNRKLWDLTVFTNRVDPNLEEDAQWIFIKALSVKDDVLVVTSEDGRRYQIDIKTKAITQPDLSRSSSTAATRDIPDAVKRAITNKSLGTEYEVSFHINPSYLRGDFNGDDKADVAVLVKKRSSGKMGIAIIHGGTDKITILGAGTGIGNGGDDFDWMDFWQIYSKDRAVRESGSVPHLRGDALLVGKSEAASALIYWDGKRYVWLQRGD